MNYNIELIPPVRAEHDIYSSIRVEFVIVFLLLLIIQVLRLISGVSVCMNVYTPLSWRQIEENINVKWVEWMSLMERTLSCLWTLFWSAFDWLLSAY